MSLTELESFALSIGEKKFRGKQLFDWLYTKEASSFGVMSSIAKSLRLRLAEISEIRPINHVTSVKSADGTLKYLFELKDQMRIESVLIPPSTAYIGREASAQEEQKRLTLCISTQVGCPLDCVFCATGKMGFFRNLTAGEIIGQILEVKKHDGRRITNLVYMGMGEPLLNYDNVMKSIEIITAGMGIAARHITVSTVGITPQIRRIADEGRKMKIALSLHSLDQETRASLMPIARKYPLADLLKTVQYYYKKLKRRPTFEYILFDAVNDREEDIMELGKLARRVPCKINLIPFHDIGSTAIQVDARKLRPTPQARINDFVKRLRDLNVTVFVRSSAGEDIDAACGQLAVSEGLKRGKDRALKKMSS
jgi:23S rRNA (adenine2503-C2)-methyltransferase